MGNIEATPGDDGWKFVGRDKEMQEIKELIQKNQSVQVSGIMKIGKSRFISELYTQLLENKQCILKDFDLDDVNSGSVLYDWFQEILTTIDATKEKREFENRYKSETIACNSCEKCQNKDTDKCLKRKNIIDTELKSLIKCLRKCPKEIVLFLDNIEKIIDSPLKDSFFSFIRMSISQTKMRTILASSNKIKQTLKSFASFELKPLDKSAILELLFETTEQRERDSEVQKDIRTHVIYSPELKVFKMDNKPYIEAIAGLCEGCPLAAIMSGLLLTEDECLYTPANLVEILICMRLTGLSPENCPPDDRLEICQSQMKEVVEVSSFFNAMNENTTGTTFSIHEAVAVAEEACESVETEAMVKLKILKKALDRSILSIESMSGEQQMNWHGILRECQFSLQVLDNLPSDVDKTKEMVLKFMKENVKKAGLDFDEEILSDPKSLERAIKSLTLVDSDKPSEQAQEGREKRSLSIREEHQVATELFDAEQNEEDLQEDLENNPDDPSSASTKRKAYRYARASNDSSDNEHELEFKVINNKQAKEAMNIKAEQSSSQNDRETNKELPFSRPPSYSRIQDSTNPSAALNLNQREPPPSYSFIDPARTSPNVEVTKHGTISQTGSSAMPTSRSNSWPIDTNLLSSSKFENRKQEGQNTVSNSNPEKISRTNLLRLGSDPSCNRPFDRVPSQLSVTSRREIDTSSSYSLTGPPAMSYTPPSIEGEPHEHIYLHSDNKDPQHDMERQASGYVVKGLNEPNTNLNGPKSDSILFGFSSKGPADLTYNRSLSNDLSIDQDNSMSASLPFSQTHYIKDRSQMNGQPPTSRLFIDQSKEEHRRRSPVAVVSPVPRRRSPPNVEKHSPQDQRNPGEAQL